MLFALSRTSAPKFMSKEYKEAQQTFLPALEVLHRPPQDCN